MFPANATLVQIGAPGETEPNGDAGAPSTVWSGRARGYLKRERRQTNQSGISHANYRDIFYLRRTEGAPVIEEAGSEWEAYTVVIQDERTSDRQKRSYVVRGMENRAAGTAVDSIRLELDNEAA